MDSDGYLPHVTKYLK